MIQSNSEVIHTIRVFFASSLMARDKNGCKKFYKNNSTRKGKCRTARQKEGDRKRRKGVKKPRVKNPLYGKGTATQYWCDPTRSITMLKNRKQTRCAYLTSRYGNKTNTIVRPNPAKLPQILRPQIKAPATKEPLTQLPKTNTIVRPNAAKLPQILRPPIPLVAAPRQAIRPKPIQIQAELIQLQDRPSLNYMGNNWEKSTTLIHNTPQFSSIPLKLIDPNNPISSTGIPKQKDILYQVQSLWKKMEIMNFTGIQWMQDFKMLCQKIPEYTHGISHTK